MEPNSRLHVDLDAIARNARAIRSRLPAGTALCGVVKADAYGLGARSVARALVEAGTSMLAVYDVDEAADLLAAGLDRPVLLLGPRFEPPEGPLVDLGARDGQLHLSASSPDGLAAIASVAGRAGRPVPVHVEIDTGLVRGGCSERDAPRLVATALADRRFLLAGVFTHMADADDDEAVNEQATRFRAVLDGLPPLPRSCRLHVANTRTVVRRPDLTEDMVRCGQGWAGFGDEPTRRFLERTVAWRSRIVHVRGIRAGASVGYGRRWRAARPSRIGLVPVGYADGFPRRLGGGEIAPNYRVAVGSPGGAVAWCSVVGAVNMDQLTIDLTDVPPAIDSGPGATVELVGRDAEAPNDLQVVAEASGTSIHELLCRLGPRVRRTPEQFDRNSVPIRPAAIRA